MKTARQYQAEIAAWANHNFTYIDKVGFGMVEELGEYCHAILKNRQGIRQALKGGSKNEAPGPMVARAKQIALEEELQDCIADGLIFTLHWAEVNGAFISFEETNQQVIRFADQSEFYHLSNILHHLGQAIYCSIADQPEGIESEPPRIEAQRVFNDFAMIAKSRGWDWEPLLEKTWAKVSQRDWIKFPFDGKTK